MRVRIWALEQAMFNGGVTTAELRDEFDFTLRGAAGRLAKLRAAGLLEVELSSIRGRWRNVLTDAGRAFLAQPSTEKAKQIPDANPLCAALGLTVRQVPSAGRVYKFGELQHESTGQQQGSAKGEEQGQGW